MSTLSVSRPPIRAASAVTAGWRNLIVQLAGGGAKAADVELSFDGKRYPSNPSVPGPRVRPARLDGAETMIADFQSFDQAQPLPTAAAKPALVGRKDLSLRSAVNGCGPATKSESGSTAPLGLSVNALAVALDVPERACTRW